MADAAAEDIVRGVAEAGDKLPREAVQRARQLE
jgi:hypothetical protein